MSKNESFPGDIRTPPPGEDVALKGDICARVPGQTNPSAAEEPARPGGERALVSDFKRRKLEKEAQKNWDLLVLLEAGCGVGNCIFPLLEEDLNMFVYACDFSPRAVEFVK
ncbi:hypothetical protein FQN60_017321, partial [Etheostoma spectabile]